MAVFGTVWGEHERNGGGNACGDRGYEGRNQVGSHVVVAYKEPDNQHYQGENQAAVIQLHFIDLFGKG